MRCPQPSLCGGSVELTNAHCPTCALPAPAGPAEPSRPFSGPDTAAAMAAAAPEAAPTFNWTGMGRPEGAHIHYQSFYFAGQHYTLGDCVYLLPEEEGSPPYIARLVRAYEDTNAKEAERLVIEVRLVSVCVWCHVCRVMWSVCLFASCLLAWHSALQLARSVAQSVGHLRVFFK